MKIGFYGYLNDNEGFQKVNWYYYLNRDLD